MLRRSVASWPSSSHNTTIPTKKSQVFSDGQTAIKVKIFQGERKVTSAYYVSTDHQTDGPTKSTAVAQHPRCTHCPPRSLPPSFSDSSLTSIFIAFYFLLNAAATLTLSLISALSRSMLRSAIVLSTAVDDFKRLMSQEKVSSMMFPPMTLMPSGCNVWLVRLTPIPKPPPTKCSPSSCSWFQVKLLRLWKLTHGAFWLPFLRRHYQASQELWPLSCCVPNLHIAIANKCVDVKPERQVLSRVLCSWIFTFS